MFIYLGSKFVNLFFVQTISPSLRTGGDSKVDVKYADGTEECLACDPEILDRLQDIILPAPPGFKSVIVTEDIDGAPETITQEIIAFRYSGPDSDLIPISVYNIKNQSILCPDGQVVTPESGIDPNYQIFLERKERGGVEKN